MVHPSVATTQVATKTPVPWDVLPAIETAKWDPRPDRAPCLPLVPASHPEEPSGESIAQHFLASDNKNVLPIRFGPHNLIYWIPVCSILYCRCEHPASRGGDPGFGPFTCVPASEPALAGLSPHQPTLPAATRGAQASQSGGWSWCFPECRHQCSQLSAKEGSAGETVSAKPAPAREGDPATAVCLSGEPSALGAGSLPQSFSKNLPWKVHSCLLASSSGVASGRDGEGQQSVWRGEGITSAHTPRLTTQLSTFSGRHGGGDVA